MNTLPSTRRGKLTLASAHTTTRFPSRSYHRDSPTPNLFLSFFTLPSPSSSITRYSILISLPTYLRLPLNLSFSPILPSSSLTFLSFPLLLGVRIYIYLSSFFSRVHLSSLTSAGYIYLSSLLHRLKMIARESVRGPSWIDADIDQTIPSFGRLVHSCLSHTFQPCSLPG